MRVGMWVIQRWWYFYTQLFYPIFAITYAKTIIIAIVVVEYGCVNVGIETCIDIDITGGANTPWMLSIHLSIMLSINLSIMLCIGSIVLVVRLSE